MKKLFALMLLSIIVLSGCVQTTGNVISQDNIVNNQIDEIESKTGLDFEIKDVSWDTKINTTWDGQCLVTNVGSASASVECNEKEMFCEVYLNGEKINYNDGLQECDDRIYVREHFAILKNTSFWYTRIDLNKGIRICCSLLDDSSKFIEEQQVCKNAFLERLCI